MTIHNVVLENYGPVVIDIPDRNRQQRSWASEQFVNYAYMVAGGSAKHPGDAYYAEHLEGMGGTYVSGTILAIAGGQMPDTYDEIEAADGTLSTIQTGGGPVPDGGFEVEGEPLETNPVTLGRYAYDYQLDFGDGPYDAWEL